MSLWCQLLVSSQRQHSVMFILSNYVPLWNRWYSTAWSPCVAMAACPQIQSRSALSATFSSIYGRLRLNKKKKKREITISIVPNSNFKMKSPQTQSRSPLGTTFSPKSGRIRLKKKKKKERVQYLLCQTQTSKWKVHKPTRDIKVFSLSYWPDMNNPDLNHGGIFQFCRNLDSPFENQAISARL